MNIRNQLRRAHSRANADLVAGYVLESETNRDANADERIVELMTCFLSEEVVVAQRAAQVVGLVGREAPRLLIPWFAELVDAAANPVHEAIRRNAIRYFSETKLPLPRKLEASLIELCNQFVADENVHTAIAAFSMQLVADRAADYPDAAQKLKQGLRQRLPNASAGFQNRAKKILSNLDAHE